MALLNNVSVEETKKKKKKMKVKTGTEIPTRPNIYRNKKNIFLIQTLNLLITEFSLVLSFCIFLNINRRSSRTPNKLNESPDSNRTLIPIREITPPAVKYHYQSGHVMLSRKSQTFGYSMSS